MADNITKITLNNLINEIDTLLETKNLKEKFEIVFKTLNLNDYKKIENPDILTAILCWCVQQTTNDDSKTRYVRISLLDKEVVSQTIQKEMDAYKQKNPMATPEQLDKANVSINYHTLNHFGSHMMLFDILKYFGTVSIHHDNENARVLYAQVDKHDQRFIRLYMLNVSKNIESFLVHSDVITTLYNHVTNNQPLKMKPISFGSEVHSAKYVLLKAKANAEMLKNLTPENKKLYLQELSKLPKTWNVIYQVKDNDQLRFANTLQLNELQVKAFKDFLTAYQRQLELSQQQIDEIKKQEQLNLKKTKKGIKNNETQTKTKTN